jgi:hypothetical protein
MKKVLAEITLGAGFEGSVEHRVTAKPGDLVIFLLRASFR